jgi:protein TonB
MPALPVVPPWLRGTALGFVMLAHAVGILAVPWPAAPDVAAPVTLQIDVVAGGEAAQSLSPIEAREVAETPPPTELAELAAVEANEVATAPPVDQTVPRDATEVTRPKEERPVRSAEAIPLPPEPQPPPPPELHDVVAVAPQTVESVELSPAAPSAARPPPAALHAPDPSELRRKEEEAARRKEEAEKRRRLAALPPQVASRSGVATGQGEKGAAHGAVASADYRALVIAELARHKRYPEAARAAGVTGTVVVSFTIGSGGRVTTSSVVQSSGSSVLDGAARQMVSALSLPPPPGGHFSATAPVRYSLPR